MICLLASSRLEADRYAYGQQLKKDEWFCPENVNELYGYYDFHVIVLPGFANLPESFRDKLFVAAKERGRRN